MSIHIISCLSSNNGIGVGDNLLFEIKEDLQHFQNHTKGNFVILGRKSFESILKRNNRPLPNRTNIVLTKNKSYKPPRGVFVFNNIDEILKGVKTLGDKDKKVYICGGSEIYKLFLPYADEVILTHVDKVAEVTTNYYPMELQNSLGFIPLEPEEYYSDKYECKYSFVKYTRNPQGE